MGAQRKDSPEGYFLGESLHTIKLQDYWDWAPNGLCIKTPQHFDVNGNPQYAKLVCDMCPVSNQCLAWAVLYNEAGIWGGTTEKERKLMFSKSIRERLIQRAREQNQYVRRIPPEKTALAALFRDFLS